MLPRIAPAPRLQTLRFHLIRYVDGRDRTSNYFGRERLRSHASAGALEALTRKPLEAGRIGQARRSEHLAASAQQHFPSQFLAEFRPLLQCRVDRKSSHSQVHESGVAYLPPILGWDSLGPPHKSNESIAMFQFQGQVQSVSSGVSKNFSFALAVIENLGLFRSHTRVPKSVQ